MGSEMCIRDRLTTFRQPVDAMADYIMTLLTDPDAGDAAGRRVHAAPVWRRSVRPR